MKQHFVFLALAFWKINLRQEAGNHAKKILRGQIMKILAHHAGNI